MNIWKSCYKIHYALFSENVMFLTTSKILNKLTNLSTLPLVGRFFRNFLKLLEVFSSMYNFLDCANYLLSPCLEHIISNLLSYPATVMSAIITKVHSLTHQNNKLPT
jgi:hypothetical protein